MATPKGSVASAVIVRGIKPPCSVAPVTEVLEWVVPLFGDEPGTARLDLRLTCPDPPADVVAAVDSLRRGRSIVQAAVPGRRGRTVRLGLGDADARRAFCLVAPWSIDARIVRRRRHVLAIADGSRSFWVELPDAETEDLRVWFRRRGIGKLVDMDTWEPAEPLQLPTKRPRRKR